jgi:hypothetical protein
MEDCTSKFVEKEGGYPSIYKICLLFTTAKLQLYDYHLN